MKILLLFIFVGLSMADICPLPEVLYPCTCIDISLWLKIECANLDVDFSLKKVLDRTSDYFSEDVVFDYLEVRNTTIRQIEDGAVDSLKFRFIMINHNPHLSYVSPRAFNATSDVTSHLSLSNNNFRNEAPFERDIFDLFRGFKNMRGISLDGNRLTSVPEGAFKNLPFLQQIWLHNNRISKIGSRAFASGSEDLRTIYIRYNLITSRGLAQGALDGLSRRAVLDITYNLLDSLEQTSFHNPLEHAYELRVGPTGWEGFPWLFSRFHCDERADWICDMRHAGEYKIKVAGYRCKFPNMLWNVWDYCASKNATLNLM